MVPPSPESAAVSAQIVRLQSDLAQKMLRMEAIQEQQIVELINSAQAQQSTARLANLPAGVGQNLDVSV
jgi:hypothetical protein